MSSSKELSTTNQNITNVDTDDTTNTRIPIFHLLPYEIHLQIAKTVADNLDAQLYWCTSLIDYPAVHKLTQLSRYTRHTYQTIIHQDLIRWFFDPLARPAVSICRNSTFVSNRDKYYKCMPLETLAEILSEMGNRSERNTLSGCKRNVYNPANKKKLLFNSPRCIVNRYNEGLIDMLDSTVKTFTLTHVRLLLAKLPVEERQRFLLEWISVTWIQAKCDKLSLSGEPIHQLKQINGKVAYCPIDTTSFGTSSRRFAVLNCFLEHITLEEGVNVGKELLGPKVDLYVQQARTKKNLQMLDLLNELGA